MKLGLGLYRHMLNRENFAFAKQAGATHTIAHLVDYFRGGRHAWPEDQPTGTDLGWALGGDPDEHPAREKKILSPTPMAKFGEPNDIGLAAVYLTSPAAKFMAGVILPVDGGVGVGF